MEWITTITILRAKQWGSTPAFGMRKIGQLEVDLWKQTGLKLPLLHPSAILMLLLLLLTWPQRRFWTATKSRSSSGCEITIWSMITVLTPRGFPRGYPRNASELWNQFNTIFWLMNSRNLPCPFKYSFLPSILVYDLHCFIDFWYTIMYINFVRVHGTNYFG